MHRAGSGDAPFPATYSRLAVSDVEDDGEPVLRDDDFCTAQCWYDQDVYTPAGMPDTVYVIGSNAVRRAAVQHERRRLRQRPLERPRGALLRHGRRSGRP